MKTIFFPRFAFGLGALLMTGSPLFSQSVEDLWITEVNPSTGQIEVTNVSREEFTTPQTMAFCHRFNYSATIPANTTFAPGESRIYTTNFGNQPSSDLWIYRSTGGFGNPANLLNGLQWGGTAGIGRASVAVSGGHWDAVSSHVPSPGPDESLLLTGPDPFSAANWTVGPADLGNFVRNVPPLEVELNIEDGLVNLTWTGGLPPFQILASETLEPESFVPIANDLDARSFSQPIAANTRQFFQVRELELTATFEVSFRSAWSLLAFAEVPANNSFGDIIGSTHNDTFTLWEPGSLSSSAFASLIEEGQSSAIRNVVDSAIANGSAGTLIDQPGVFQELGSRTFQITVRRDSPLLSLASALQASPDWLVGLENYSLLDGNGDWRQAVEVGLDVYDAGVDSAFGFNSPDFPTFPVEAITSIQNNPLFTTPSLLIGFNSDAPAPPVAALVITRIDNQ